MKKKREKLLYMFNAQDTTSLADQAFINRRRVVTLRTRSRRLIVSNLHWSLTIIDIVDACIVRATTRSISAATSSPIGRSRLDTADCYEKLLL